MKEIVMRAGKSPFDVVTHEEFIHQDLMGTNSGNLLFSDAVHKQLTVPGTEVVAAGLRTDSSKENAARINERFDLYAVPLANAFRPSFGKSLDKLSTLIEQLKIPVVVVGVGAQASTEYDTGRLDDISVSVRRFMKAVLNRSASVGVRGELTADYLKKLGFKDVEVIGCPSMFWHGDTFPELEAKPLDAGSRVAVNVSSQAEKEGGIAELTAHALSLHPELTYYAQNLTDAELLFWGDTSVAGNRRKPLPGLRSHPLVRGGHTRVPVDPATWMAELAEHDFSFGTRIHGNMAALLAGTPSVVLAHDSRTLELCRYFEIPHRLLREVEAGTAPADLLAEADYTALRKNHAERFRRYTDFLDRNGVQNTFSHGDGGKAWQKALDALELPPSVTSWDGSDDGALGYRMAWLREQAVTARRGREKTAAQLREVEAENKELRKLTASLEKRTASLEARLDQSGGGVRRVGRGVKRRAKGMLGKD
ncbi:polysaccharide pyruvyl transferase family protein [Streptomyces xiaopingdaonensis]|uniref:polysaccharide pyruvyl transferase family protein n=1 Tax=Streptomyces xiaopingdaonensis TaxID=1565415 RepID=UPI00031721B6|nr:polysaccharide pyruvyl transferase family protein [Streptomyces xiaopingdaonensis]